MTVSLLVNSVEIGSLADWFSAIGTITGVSVTGIGLLREAARRRADMEARRRDEEYRLAGQARLIFSRASIRGLAAVAVVVMNESPGPVLNLSARLIVFDAVDGTATFPDVSTENVNADRLDAHSSCELSIDLGVDDDLDLADTIAIELRFTDMAGLAWSRLDHGEPQRIIPS
jgi:hypothetical protein